VLNIATLGGSKALLTEPNTLPVAGEQDLIATFGGYNAGTGRFAVTVFARGGNGGGGKPRASYFGAKLKREQLDQADDVLKNVYRHHN
jgi:hypothetical protein